MVYHSTLKSNNLKPVRGSTHTTSLTRLFFHTSHMKHADALSVSSSDEEYQRILDEFDAERSLKNTRRALAVIKRAMALRPTYFMVYYKLALLYKQMGDNLKLNQALKMSIWYCSTSEEKDSQENLYWLNILRGFECTCNKAHAEAEHYYKVAIEIFPNRMEAYFRYALALGSQGQYANAIPMFIEAKRCVEEDMESTEERVQVLSCESFSSTYKLALCIENIGWSYAHQEMHDQALQYYTEAINVYPNFVLFHENRFFSNKTKGNHLAAIADCENAIRLTSDDATKAKLTSMIASVYVLMNQHCRARELYEQAIRINPSSHNPYYDLAVIAPFSNDHNMALSLVNQGLENCKESMGRYWLLYRRSNIYAFMGKLNESNNDKRLMKSLTRLMIERVD
jgi:tetratricopeptide (TPR) repeat protein